MSQIRLCVNVDHVATVRQARGGNEPDPVVCARICEESGAHGITVHLREDRRHIQDRDVFALQETVTGTYNLEMALAGTVIAVARQVHPAQITLVPERREELTTEGGLDVFSMKDAVTDFIAEFHERGIIVSLFVEPDMKIVDLSREVGADYIEIHTGTYCNASDALGQKEAERIYRAAAHAVSLGLGVNAGHGLNYENLQPLLGIEGLHELNIGHSIVSRAMVTGIGEAVREMLAIIERG